MRVWIHVIVKGNVFESMVKSRRGKEKETAPPEDVAVGSKRARKGTGV
ncbi:hypothetical protein Hanom_Chr15g01385821 [Helianthus anomalus]